MREALAVRMAGAQGKGTRRTRRPCLWSTQQRAGSRSPGPRSAASRRFADACVSRGCVFSARASRHLSGASLGRSAASLPACMGCRSTCLEHLENWGNVAISHTLVSMPTTCWQGSFAVSQPGNSQKCRVVVLVSSAGRQWLMASKVDLRGEARGAMCLPGAKCRVATRQRALGWPRSCGLFNPGADIATGQ